MNKPLVQILPFIRDFVNLITASLSATYSEFRLTKTQKLWLSFCLTGILLTNTICWARFERGSFGSWLEPALSWMFRKSKIDWHKLLKGSIKVILEKYEIESGSLELDDTERERSKNAKQIYGLGKQKDKKSGGYFNGQSILVLLLPRFPVFFTPKKIINLGDGIIRRIKDTNRIAIIIRHTVIIKFSS